MKRHRSRPILVLLSVAAHAGGYPTVQRGGDKDGTPHNSDNQILHVALG